LVIIQFNYDIDKKIKDFLLISRLELLDVSGAEKYEHILKMAL